MFRIVLKKRRLKKLTMEEKLYECRINNHDVWDDEFERRLRVSCKTCHPIINAILDLPASIITVPMGGILGFVLIVFAKWPWLLASITAALFVSIITPGKDDY
jgi:hypothetical protein